jgi:hypothetical protein
MLVYFNNKCLGRVTDSVRYQDLVKFNVITQTKPFIPFNEPGQLVIGDVPYDGYACHARPTNAIDRYMSDDGSFRPMKDILCYYEFHRT